MAALIAYLRSPTEPFAGLDDQREAVQAWATKRRHQIVATFEDNHGTDLQQRSALISAIAVLGEAGIDGVVVCQLASLDEDLVAQEQLLAEIRKLGAKVYSLNPDEAGQLRRTPADSSRKFVREVLQAAAGNEASLAAIRSAARSGAGGRQGGSPPFGYRMDNGQLVPDPDEQATLARISQLRSEGATLREIARALEAEGYRTKRSNRWHPETLRRIAGRVEP
jgi:site-specific DNA recombinase